MAELRVVAEKSLMADAPFHKFFFFFFCHHMVSSFPVVSKRATASVKATFTATEG
jgi:hypothetical protein